MDQPLSPEKNPSAYSIYITWSKPVEGGVAKEVAEYVVRWSPTDNYGNQSKRVPKNFTTLDNLTPNSQYNINIAARTEVGDSSTDGALLNFEAITCQ